MPRKQKQSTTPSIRRKAKNREVAAKIREEIAGLPPEDLRRRCFELRIREIELETHNRMLLQTRRALEEARAQYVNLYDFVPVGYVSLNKYGKIRSANLTAASMLGIERSGLIGKYLSRFVAGSHKDQFHRTLKGLIDNRDRQVCQLLLVKTDNTVFHARLEWMYIEFADAAKSETRLSITDISDQKIAESELEASREKLRQLSRYLQSIRERERYTVSRAIHDELSQVLAVLKMDLSSLENHFAKGDTSAGEKLESIRSLLDRTIKVTRFLVNDLRPYLLDELGLKSAVQWAARDFKSRSGLEIKTIIDVGDLPVDEPRAVAAYRILQELLANVERHSNASSVVVHLRSDSENLILDVIDDGRGITPLQIEGPSSFGLMGIQERAFEFGGDVEIAGNSEEGTRVTVRIPL